MHYVDLCTYLSYALSHYQSLCAGGGSRGQPKKKRAKKEKETEEVVKPTKQTHR